MDGEREPVYCNIQLEALLEERLLLCFRHVFLVSHRLAQVEGRVVKDIQLWDCPRPLLEFPEAIDLVLPMLLFLDLVL